MSMFVLQEMRAVCNVMWGVFNSLYSFYILQVQNLNNIMAFPLENVLKSELRDSRLVSLVFSTYSSNTSIKPFVGLTAVHMMICFQCLVLGLRGYSTSNPLSSYFCIVQFLIV